MEYTITKSFTSILDDLLDTYVVQEAKGNYTIVNQITLDAYENIINYCLSCIEAMVEQMSEPQIKDKNGLSDIRSMLIEERGAITEIILKINRKSREL